MTNSEDHELVAQVANGDERAFLVLYNRHVGKVYARGLRILRDPMLTEEVTQDTFLKLWGRARLYHAERGTLLAWLLAITKRTALDRLRQEARRPALADEKDPEDLWQDIPDAGTTCEESRWRSILFAVRSLSPQHRQVLELAYYHGLSQREIGETLGWPLGTVKTRLPAAVKQLRREWGKQP